MTEGKKGMALWLKIVLIVGIVLILVCGGGALLLYKLGSDFMKGFTDEETMLKITKAICNIEIPEGYKVKGAFELAGFQFSMISHESTAHEIMFMRLPESYCSDKQMKESFNDEKFADELLKQNKQGSGSLQVEKVKRRENAKVNGKNFPYALCDFNQNGEKKEGIMGYFSDSASKRGFLVFAYNTPGKYDNDITLKLLENVK